MAIEHGHEFKKEHGFSGSAHPHKDHRPKIHGYEYGGGVDKKIHTAIKHHEEEMHGGHESHHIKHGGSVHKDHGIHAGKVLAHDHHDMHMGKTITGSRDHYKKGGFVDHDGEKHLSHVAYDKHGFQHSAHAGKSAHHHAKKHGK